MKNRLFIIDDEPRTCEVVSGFWQVLKNNSGLVKTWGAGGRERAPAQFAGCSKWPSSEAGANEAAMRTLCCTLSL